MTALVTIRQLPEWCMSPLKPRREWLNLLLDFCTLFSGTENPFSCNDLNCECRDRSLFFLCHLPKLGPVGVGREAISLCSLPTHARMYLCGVITVLNQLSLLSFQDGICTSRSETLFCQQLRMFPCMWGKVLLFTWWGLATAVKSMLCTSLDLE